MFPSKSLFKLSSEEASGLKQYHCGVAAMLFWRIRISRVEIFAGSLSMAQWYSLFVSRQTASCPNGFFVFVSPDVTWRHGGEFH